MVSVARMVEICGCFKVQQAIEFFLEWESKLTKIRLTEQINKRGVVGNLVDTPYNLKLKYMLLAASSWDQSWLGADDYPSLSDTQFRKW